MGKETMFPKFGDLPKELRLQVYENAFPRRVLRFCERLLPGHMGLTEPLGPPAIAQTCREAWKFAGIRYKRLTYHAAKLRATSDEQPVVSPPPKPTWFNPGVDVICIHLVWQAVAVRTTRQGGQVRKHGIRLYNPERSLEPDDTDLDKTGKMAYAEIVRALRPFAELAETAVVSPSRHSDDHFIAYDFFPYADNSIFPNLKTILVAARSLQMDYNKLLPPPTPPRHRWLVGLLDGNASNLDEQVIEQFGDLDPRWIKDFAEEIRELAKERNATWDPIKPRRGDMAPIRRQHKLSRFGAAQMWLKAARYLRNEFTVTENGDRVYASFHGCYFEDKWTGAELTEAERTEGLPRFEPVVMVHRLPLFL